MSTPAAQIVTSGTPITSRLGVGAVAGNTVTIAGLTLAPNQPGWTLTGSTGGPGFVTGTWQFGTAQAQGANPAQGAYYRSGSGGAGSGGSGVDEEPLFNESQMPGARISKTGWVILGLLLTLMLTSKGN